MGRLFEFTRYKTRSEDGGRIDPDDLRRLARKAQPRLVLCGSSSYPRLEDYALFREIADDVGALAMADVSHLGGLIAANALPNPLDFGFDVVTTTTHKSLRGPRGGIILCRKEHAARIDKSVFPGLQGGPHMNQVAGTAVALAKAARPEFRAYALQILRNAKALAASLSSHDVELVTGGTDNHLLVADTARSCGLDGRRAEELLDAIGIATNKQLVPDDPRPPLRPSGIRLGSPAATTRGMREREMQLLGQWIASVLERPDDEDSRVELAAEVAALCAKFPVPGIAAQASAGLSAPLVPFL
jgi:glycine hydroxymethyltransferase